MFCSPKTMEPKGFSPDGAFDRVLQRRTFWIVSAGAGSIQQRESHTTANPQCQ